MRKDYEKIKRETNFSLIENSREEVTLEFAKSERFYIILTPKVLAQKRKDPDIVVIEVNGVASLPTHMFDPDLSVQAAYRIFLQHAKLLVDIAAEHRHQPMALKSYSDLWRQAKANHTLLNQLHEQSMRKPQSS